MTVRHRVGLNPIYVTVQLYNDYTGIQSARRQFDLIY